jgi:5-methyltetrahydropteroyltriglutamate--homocysteine methyltransferase
MFEVTQVGSWPRSRELLAALRERQWGRMPRDEFEKVADAEIERCVRDQLEAGVDIVVDGELRRDNFYSFVADKLEGVRLMSLADMLETVEDKASFEEMLTTLDVPASAIKNPTCVGRLTRREPLALDELRYLRTLTDRSVKITLPGPYLLTRAMWVSAYSGSAYEDKADMGKDVVRILSDELLELANAGCEFVQFDEPVFSEIVMSEESGRRTFMCATLATRRDPASELAYAAELLNAVVDGARTRCSRALPRIGLHVCRGNWSRDEGVLLSGDYEPLLPAFLRMHVDQFVLEYSTPRAGEIAVVGKALGAREVGLGVINPRTDRVETPEEIVGRVEQALEYFEPDRIFLNPDCGFGCFANRCVNDVETARAKTVSMVEAARRLRAS